MTPQLPQGFLSPLYPPHPQRVLTRQCCEPCSARSLHRRPALHSAGPMRLPATGSGAPLPTRGGQKWVCLKMGIRDTHEKS